MADYNYKYTVWNIVLNIYLYDIVFFSLASSCFGSVILELEMGSRIVFDVYGFGSIYEVAIWRI